MEFTDLKYFKNLLGQDAFVKCKKDGHECVVPMKLDNPDYKEIKKQLDAGQITIAASD